MSKWQAQTGKGLIPMAYPDYDDRDYEEEFNDEYSEHGSVSSPNKEIIRAENEDDDGYDPYSDRRPQTPLFEPDPWR